MAPYDHIIVGAGTAGCVLAGRLAAAGRRVLLLEAGQPPVGAAISSPSGWPMLINGAVDWSYQSEPEPELLDRRLHLARGKVMGGSSAINGMLYVRGHHDDYRRWAETANDETWSFERILDRFKRSEDHHAGASEFHGAGGPMPVASQAPFTSYADAFVDAGLELGLRRNEDLNGAFQDGVGNLEVHIRDGRRCSSWDAFVDPKSEALTAMPGMCATRLLFEKNRVVGVLCRDAEGREVEYRCERELVLATGALETPRLLQLSGIGPADELRALDIEVVADRREVGRGMLDHPRLVFGFAADALVEFHEQSTGTESVAFLATSQAPSPEHPDLEILFRPGALHANAPLVGFSCVHLRAQSLGSVRLRSADPDDSARIFCRYLSEPDDLETMLDAIEFAEELAATKALESKLVRTLDAAPRDREGRIRFVRRRLSTTWHNTGSCRMGGDEDAVVDARLQVNGVENLRIADASVIPGVCAGNPNAAVMMVAEACAEFLLQA